MRANRRRRAVGFFWLVDGTIWAGFVNIDVECIKDEEDCTSDRKWEIHAKINGRYDGSLDVGPNLYAIAAGARAGVAGGIGTNVAIGGTMALGYEYEVLSRLNAKLGPVVAQILAKGPTALCLLHANAR